MRFSSNDRTVRVISCLLYGQQNAFRKEKTKFKGSRYFTSGNERAYLSILRFKPSYRITEFSELTYTPARKYIYFWEKTIIFTAVNSTLVQLRYYMTREIPPTFSRINGQLAPIPTEKCFKLALKPCGHIGKRKYNLKGISTVLRHHL